MKSSDHPLSLDDIFNSKNLTAGRAKKLSRKGPPDDVAAAPSHDDIMKDRAHAAHRDVVEQWVKGETSTHKMKQSHARLRHVIKTHR